MASYRHGVTAASGVQHTGRIGWGWAVALVAAALYGSLIPFDISFSALIDVLGWRLPRLGFGKPGIEDLVTNVVIYLPVGCVMVLAQGRRRTVVGSIAFAVAVGAVVSISAELMQGVVASRVSSWIDVVLNVVGTALGGAMMMASRRAFGAVVVWLGATFTTRPFTSMASVVTLGLLFFNLAPFDFVTDTAGLQQSFLSTTWDVSVTGDASSAVPLTALLLPRLHGAVWFAVFGYLLVLTGLEAGRCKKEVPLFAMTQGAALIGAVVVLQLFMRSHPFDMGRVLLSALGVVAGVWMALYMLDMTPQRNWREGTGLAVPSSLLWAAVLIEVVVLWLSSMETATTASAGLPLSAWLPFHQLWRGSMLDAACSMGSTLAVYGVLSVAVGTLLRRGGVSRAWFATACVVVCVALVRVGLESAAVVGMTDAAGPLLALVSAVVVARVHASLPSRPVIAVAHDD